MLELRDFFHLPQVESLIEQLVTPHPGMILVAGVDPRPAADSTPQLGYQPSGRLTIFRLLLRRFLAATPETRAIIVAADRDVIRIPRKLRRRVTLLTVDPSLSYQHLITEAVRRRPDLLVIDRIEEAAVDALKATQQGIPVLSQIDSVFSGPEVIRHLLDIGVPTSLHRWLTWVLAVNRVKTLCSHCKAPHAPDPEQLRTFGRQYPGIIDGLKADVWFGARGCPACQHTGRAGDMIVFDFHRLKVDPEGDWQIEGALTREAYLLELATRGLVPLDDVFHMESELLHQTFNMLALSERTRAETSAELQRKLAELEAANLVLQGRTEALISLHDIGQALTTSHRLDELARRVCRYTPGICGADRAVLYYLRHENTAEIIAVTGWDSGVLHKTLTASEVLGPRAQTEPKQYSNWPPGIPPRHPDVEGAALRAGLRVPLIAQGARVGMMIVHSTTKRSFNPGEVALLQTFANQAAVAIQRAGLIEQLQEKISALEVAQTELVEMERMEHEMELARQVQQSVLPRVFPIIPGYRFGALNQPARQVGGDFYDVIPLDGDRFGLVIADVSDKGMPAALYMALTRSLILAEARREQSPRVVLNNVHRLLLELGQPDMFVTVFYGIVDGPHQRMTYVRAGHDMPILLRNDQAFALGGEGTFLGFPDLDELHLSEEQIELKTGDRLVLYTDGLIDNLSTQQKRFGLERLRSDLRAHASLPPGGLCDAIFDALTAYQEDADQYDDMAILVIAVD